MKKKLSLITGGLSGIGFEVSKKMVLSGHDLIVVYISDDENAKKSLAELKNLNQECSIEVLKLNLGDEAGVTSLLETINTKFNHHRLENFVSCHGRVIPGIFLQLKTEAITNTLHEHLISNIIITRGILQRMCVQKFGRIVFLGSMASHRINRGQAPYALAKAALETFVKSLTAEYFQRNVTFNCVSPGVVETKVTKRISQKMNSEGRIKTVGPEEVANLIMYLCSEENKSISGASLRIDAGQAYMNNNNDHHKLSFYTKKSEPGD